MITADQADLAAATKTLGEPKVGEATLADLHTRKATSVKRFWRYVGMSPDNTWLKTRVRDVCDSSTGQQARVYYGKGRKAARRLLHTVAGCTGVALIFAMGFAIEGWELTLGVAAVLAIAGWPAAAGIAASVAVVGLLIRYFKYKK